MSSSGFLSSSRSGYRPLLDEPDGRTLVDAAGYVTDDGLAPPAPTSHSLNSNYTTRSKDDAMLFARGLSEDPGISEMVATRSARWASSRLETWFVYWAFFWCGMGTATVWNLFLTLYPFFERELKQEVLVFILAAYNLPGLPVLLFQARCDAPVDKRIGSKPAYLMRISFCMVILLVIVLGFPYLDRTFPLLISAVVLIGFSINVMYGSLFQLVTFFPPKAVTFLYLGNGFSSISSLLFTLGFGLFQNVANCGQFQLFCMFYACAGVVAVSFFMFLLLMNTSMANGAMELKDMLEREEDEEEVDYYDTRKSKDSIGSGCSATCDLLRRVRLVGASLLVNLASTVLAASFFNRVPEQDLRLGEVLSYVYIVGDVVGRQLSILFGVTFGPRGPIIVLVLNLIRAGFCAAWIVYAFVPFFTSDIAVLIFCGLFFSTGGFLNSVTYSFVRTTVSEGKLLTKAAALVNLMLQSGCIVAVAISFIIKTMLPLPDHVTPHGPS